MMQVTLPGGEMRGKSCTSLSAEVIEPENIPHEATGPSLFLLPYPAGLAEREKKKFQNITEHERLWAFGYWRILMQVCFSQSSRYYLHSEAVRFLKSLYSQYVCIVRHLWIMDDGVKGKVRWEWVYSCMVCSLRPGNTRITATFCFTHAHTHTHAHTCRRTHKNRQHTWMALVLDFSNVRNHRGF